jgi:hypothetical protein
MLFSYGSGRQQIDGNKKCRQIWQCSGTTQGPLPNEAHPGLHWKPLDATIGQVLAFLYHPGGRHGQRIRIKTQNTNKTQHLATTVNFDR